MLACLASVLSVFVLAACAWRPGAAPAQASTGGALASGGAASVAAAPASATAITTAGAGATTSADQDLRDWSLGAPLSAVGQAAEQAPLMPDFTLRRLQGAPWRLAEQRGRVVLLQVWGTWCGPCRSALPTLAPMAKGLDVQEVQVLGLNIDADPQAPQVAAMAAALGPGLPQLLDPQRAVARHFTLHELPTTVLIDRDGRVRHLQHGWVPGQQAALERRVRALVLEQRPGAQLLR